ncbi:lytic transglycosylase domain-containing protein [bacterium]|nr:lytic transglycosylase domain-containing protein [bacterium]
MKQRKAVKVIFLILAAILSVWLICAHFQVGKIFYPLKYKETVAAAASEAHISPYLLAAVIMTESGFNEKSRSEAGALGLMQLMPQTAWWIADTCGIELPEKKSELLLDPEINIRLGAKYLEWLYIHFELSQVEALAAYNIGQNEVRKWTEAKGRLKTENIPVAETRYFVRKVLKREAEYRKYYPELERKEN